MVEKAKIGLIKTNRTFLDKILGRNKPTPVYMRDEPPFFHYEIASGENKSAFTTIPVTQVTESLAQKTCEERQYLISQGHRVI